LAFVAQKCVWRPGPAGGAYGAPHSWIWGGDGAKGRIRIGERERVGKGKGKWGGRNAVKRGVGARGADPVYDPA